MTREEALESTDIDMGYFDVQRIINLIYDDFEQQLLDMQKRIDELEFEAIMSATTIQELQERLQPKSCDGCKWLIPLGHKGKGGMVCSSKIACIRGCMLKDKYEPKDNR